VGTMQRPGGMLMRPGDGRVDRQQAQQLPIALGASARTAANNRT
jgi:hypothetical protein